MLRLEMHLDEDQIKKNSKYNAKSIVAAVDKAFGKYNFRSERKSDGTICYYGNGHPKDYGAFGRLITSLKDKDWLVPYLDKWLWYNSDDGESENDYSIEDVLYHYTRRESIS